MTAPKFTPGPWYRGCHGHPDKIQIVVCENDSDPEVPTGLVADVNKRILWNPRDGSSPTAEANARLIASAPALYAALEGLIETEHATPQAAFAAFNAAKSALALARGEKGGE